MPVSYTHLDVYKRQNLNRKEKTTMLRNIPPILSPELLKVLAEMGHGDTIVIGDANFAAASMAKKGILVRCRCV